MSQVERLILDQTERAAIGKLVDDVYAGQTPWNALAFAQDAATVAESLPLRLREFLTRVRGTQAEVAIVSGLPVSDDLVSTPTGWDLAAKTGAGQREELMLLVCASALGDPFAWSDQQSGRMVHDVCPAPGQERSLTSASSEIDLALHTEDVHHPCRGDYVALCCLRNPDNVGTTFVRVDNLDIPDDVRRVLSDERFLFFADDSHEDAELDDDETFGGRLANRVNTTGSVLFGPAEQPYLRIDVDFAAAPAGDPAAEKAIETTFASLRGSVERVVLRPGDAVFMDNYRVVHGREPFTPRYDGNDRWLKRVNLIRDVRRVYVETRSLSRVIA
nr:Dioxygenase TauD/TfdA [uncultured bacterium]